MLHENAAKRNEKKIFIINFFISKNYIIIKTPITNSNKATTTTKVSRFEVDLFSLLVVLVDSIYPLASNGYANFLSTKLVYFENKP